MDTSASRILTSDVRQSVETVTVHRQGHRAGLGRKEAFPVVFFYTVWRYRLSINRDEIANTRGLHKLEALTLYDSARAITHRII